MSSFSIVDVLVSSSLSFGCQTLVALLFGLGAMAWCVMRGSRLAGVLVFAGCGMLLASYLGYVSNNIVTMSMYDAGAYEQVVLVGALMRTGASAANALAWVLIGAAVAAGKRTPPAET